MGDVLLVTLCPTSTLLNDSLISQLPAKCVTTSRHGKSICGMAFISTFELYSHIFPLNLSFLF